MNIDYNGKLYGMTRGSDVQRDGMYLEVSRSDVGPDAPLAEIFYSDSSRDFTFTAFTEEKIPLEVVDKFIDEAKKLLPLKNRAEER